MYVKTAPWDKFVFYATWITIILSSLICILVIFLLRNDDIELRIRSYFIFAIIGLIFTVIYLFSPNGYLITSEGIKIKRHFGTNFISGKEIKRVDVISEANIVRSFGSGGIFGYFGTFYESNERKAKVYCTRLKNVVRLETSQVIYYISPEDPNSFFKKVTEGFIENT